LTDFAIDIHGLISHYHHRANTFFRQILRVDEHNFVLLGGQDLSTFYTVTELLK